MEKKYVETSMAEDVERVTVTRTEGPADRSGIYTIVGIIVGALLIAGVAVAIIGVPAMKAWWGGDSHSESTTLTTPAP